ncbi:hypothetical protein JRQ81_012047 [Phrynocephalus forsythii]|uniref:LIM zinc-binding domain-containing protein n=1 Tax=Phrynocephalus forsythii TaxID=171643 RepID=A0A9Q1AR46_9SAUR|nr:hypothetical protein JRQ81_012047 [Phrynocephalus forsythii]
MSTEGFDCFSCKESLYGRKYIQADEGPFCIPCYDAHFANTCDECKELIGHDCRELYYEDRHYHEGCFRCFRCDCSLADEPFTCQGQELLCNACYCREFSSQCVACQQVVMPGSRKLEYSGQTWHEHCFLCSSCQEPIGSRSFIPDQNDYYCVPCYESKFAPRCTCCKKALVGANTSPLRIATGTTTASAAPAVPPPWWGRDSSPRRTRSCVVTVLATVSEEARSPHRLLPLLALWLQRILLQLTPLPQGPCLPAHLPTFSCPPVSGASPGSLTPSMVRGMVSLFTGLGPLLSPLFLGMGGRGRGGGTSPAHWLAQLGEGALKSRAALPLPTELALSSWRPDSAWWPLLLLLCPPPCILS